MLFGILLTHLVRDGTVRVIDPSGKTKTYGNGGQPSCTLRVHTNAFMRRTFANPALLFAEAYLEGELSFEEGAIEDFLIIALKNYDVVERHWLARLGNGITRQVRWVKQYNPVGQAQKNVAHHYDLSGQLYDLFLDADRQYSCAYFERPDDSLEQAQLNKKRHLAAKLLLGRPGLRLLDIGSGWGGLGLYLAEAASCDVTGVTLSVEQHKLSQERAQQAGLEQRVRFHLKDYRELEGPFERIVSVGMFEHVGKKNYDEFFAKVRDLLTEDGVCLLHTVGRFNEPGPVNPFIRKYIFPGADVPTLSDLSPAIERSGLFMTDIEVLRLHYAETLKHWHDRFQANRAKVAELYDERFCRMWELYLKACEVGFRHQGLTIFQVQLAKQQDAVPLTRDYIYDWERGRGAKHAQAAE